MKTANIIVKADAGVKQKAQRMAKEVGLTLSDVVNMSLHQFIETGTLTVSVVPRMTKKLEKTIAIAERELKEGKVKMFKTAEEFIANLKS